MSDDKKTEASKDPGTLVKQGQCYEYGNGVEYDLKKAMEYYRLAAEQGDPSGQVHLGLLYRGAIEEDESDMEDEPEQDKEEKTKQDEDEVKINPKEAVRLFNLAADQNYPQAYYE